MPSAYSVDFREHVVQQHRRMGWSQHETAEYFGICVATVYVDEQPQRRFTAPTP